MNRLPESWRIPLQISLLVVLSLGIVWGIDRSWRRDQASGVPASDDPAIGPLKPAAGTNRPVESLWSVSSPLQPTRPRPTRTPFPTRDPNVTRPPTVTRAPAVDPKLRLTPVVTPMPLATPPYIPGLADGHTEPYRISFRKENELWIMNNDGSEPRMLLDSVSRASLYLGHSPYLEFVIEWGSASPDGRTLALVLCNVWEWKGMGDEVRFSIYTFDVDIGEFNFLVRGIDPVWSPDGSRIAYVGSGGLGVVDVETHVPRQLYPVEFDHRATDVTWATDGSRIAFLDEVGGYGAEPQGFVVNVNDLAAEPVSILPKGGRRWRLTWLPNRESILFLSTGEGSTYGGDYDLWTVDTVTRETRQITRSVFTSHFALNPVYEDWVVFAGGFRFENERSLYDLWLLDLVDGSVVRLTTKAEDDAVNGPYWSPDGTQIVFQKHGRGIWTMDLRDGTERQIYPEADPEGFYIDMLVLPGS